MKKRMLVTSIICGMVFLMGGNVLAEGNYGIYSSELPNEIDQTVVVSEIEEDMMNYLASEGREVELYSDEFDEFINEVMFLGITNVEEITREYFEAYGSIYLGEIDITPYLDKTIAEIREKNMGLSNQIEHVSEEYFRTIPSATRGGVVYNLQAAQNYAWNYAIGANLSFPLYAEDCTNFASQILNAGGFPINSEWDPYGVPDVTVSPAYFNWVQASAFVQYWTLTRGYIGPVCMTREAVNNLANKSVYIVDFTR